MRGRISAESPLNLRRCEAQAIPTGYPHGRGAGARSPRSREESVRSSRADARCSHAPTQVGAYVAGKLPLDESEELAELQLMCNDVPLDREMSLATAYSFVWKTPGEEMQLQYCRAAGEAEA